MKIDGMGKEVIRVLEMCPSGEPEKKMEKL